MTLQFTKREAPAGGLTPARLGRDAGLIGGLTLLLALLGPYGTFDDMTLGRRLAYWGTAIGLNALQIGLLDALFRRLPATMGLPVWGRATLVALLASVPATFEVLFLEQLLRPGRDLVSTPMAALYLYFHVALVTLGINLPVTMLQDRTGTRAAPAGPVPVAPTASPAAPPQAPTAPVPFLRRIPPHLGEELLALEMEDHYLRIHTALGSDLILCRLSDALAELAAMDGMRVHRSFWVARAAVASARREEGRATLRLSNGMEVPVSRTFLPAVRAAGWLDGAVRN
ncbi:MAG TPA: LytTR family DNA-binding domain-containing protein [Azospirillaceae bacterium]|nr:LytTR family DNA-binding domain-containing protein [Azospirillaceae bacterium]